jgi:UDP-2-acetamido-3-amino-2,3-dideoxy-glucuronate N-acetyltransferase
MTTGSDVFVHPQGLCESDEVGPGTRIWAFAHVMKGAVVGRDCNISDHVFIETGARIGDRVTIKNQVMVWRGVEIGDDVFVGPGACFTNDAYPRSPRMALPAVAARYSDETRWLLRTRVETGATLGAGCLVLPTVKIGAYAMVAAGAVLTRDVPAHALVAGVPARRVGLVCRCGARLVATRGAVRPCPRCGEKYDERADG